MEVKKIIEKKNARVESESHASGVFFYYQNRTTDHWSSVKSTSTH